MRSGLVLLVAIAAVALSVVLGILQRQVNERLRVDLTAIEERLEGSGADLREGLEERFATIGTRLDGLSARLDGLPALIALENFDGALDALQNDLTAIEEKLEGGDADLREGLEERFATIATRLDGLDGLNARLDGLPASIAPEDFDAALDALQNNLTAIEEKLEGGDADLREGLEERLAAIGTRLDGLDGLKARLDGLPASTAPEDFDTALDALQNNLTAIEEKLEGGDADLREGLEERLAAIGTRLDGLDGLKARLDGLPASTAEDFDTALDALQNNLTAIEEKLEGGDADLREGLEERLAAIGTRLDGLDGLKARLDGLPASTALENFDTALDTLQNDLTVIEEKLEGGDADLREGLEKRLAAIGTRLDGHEARLDGLSASTALEDFDNALATLQNDLTAIEGEFEGGDAGLRQGLEERFATIGTRLDLLEARLDGLPASTALENFDSALNALQNDLTAIRERLESGGVDLRDGLEEKFVTIGTRLDRLEARQNSSASAIARLSINQLRRVGEVFFESGEFRLTSSEQERLKTQIADFKGSELVLVGSADTVGGEFYNATLSLLRATSVQQELEALLDRPINFVSVDGVGELGAPILTLDGIPEDQNRWVGIFAIDK